MDPHKGLNLEDLELDGRIVLKWILDCGDGSE
jgi:hypothetical protein